MTCEISTTKGAITFIVGNMLLRKNSHMGQCLLRMAKIKNHCLISHPLECFGHKLAKLLGAFSNQQTLWPTQWE